MIKIIIKDGQRTVFTGTVKHRLDGLDLAWKKLGVKPAAPRMVRFKDEHGRDISQELPAGYYAPAGGNLRVRDYPERLLVMLDHSVTI